LRWVLFFFWYSLPFPGEVVLEELEWENFLFFSPEPLLIVSFFPHLVFDFNWVPFFSFVLRWALLGRIPAFSAWWATTSVLFLFFLSLSSPFFCFLFLPINTPLLFLPFNVDPVQLFTEARQRMHT